MDFVVHPFVERGLVQGLRLSAPVRGLLLMWPPATHPKFEA